MAAIEGAITNHTMRAISALCCLVKGLPPPPPPPIPERLVLLPILQYLMWGVLEKIIQNRMGHCHTKFGPPPNGPARLKLAAKIGQVRPANFGALELNQNLNYSGMASLLEQMSSISPSQMHCAGISVVSG